MSLTIKFDVIELPDKPTDKFNMRTEYREYPDEAIREDEFCTVCEFPTYPECKKWCYNYELIQKEKKQAAK